MNPSGGAVATDAVEKTFQNSDTLSQITSVRETLFEGENSLSSHVMGGDLFPERSFSILSSISEDLEEESSKKVEEITNALKSFSEDGNMSGFSFFKEAYCPSSMKEMFYLAVKELEETYLGLALIGMAEASLTEIATDFLRCVNQEKLSLEAVESALAYALKNKDDLLAEALILTAPFVRKVNALDSISFHWFYFTHIPKYANRHQLIRVSQALEKVKRSILEIDS